MPESKNKSNLPPTIFLMGPTASGKTSLAIEIAKKFPVDLISVDSSQVYRGMDIGTAKPSPELLAQYPHRLVDIRDLDDPYSAADFCADALAEIGEISQSGRIPLLVGGTLFYFHALEYGLSKLPKADPEIRKRLSQDAEQRGWPAMHRRLADSDPVMAQRLNPNDSQRIQRALELLEVTGRLPSEVMTETEGEPCPYKLVKLAIAPDDRKALHARIEARFKAMIKAGLVQELQKLLKKKGLDPQLPSMKMVGYRQVLEYLQGEIDEAEMTQRAIAATRQLAKRQLTWLRSYEGVRCFNSEDPSLKMCVLTYLGQRLGYTL